MQTKQYELMAKHEKNHWWFVAKRQYAEKLLPKIRKAKILDVGSGTGAMTLFLSQFGSITGIDESQEAIRYAREKGVRIIKASSNKLPFKNSQFDIVTYFDVLYHQDVNLTQSLKEARRVLKKNKFLIITDCAHPFLFGPHDQAVHARIRFNKKNLEKEIQKAGFTIIRSSYLYCLTFPLFFLTRIIEKMTGKSPGVKTPSKYINHLLALLCRVESLILKKHSLPWGSSIIIEAKK